MNKIVHLLKYHSIRQPCARNFLQIGGAGALICAALIWPAPAAAQPPSPAAERRDGQHDFDFDIGVWKTHLKRLVHSLSGSTTWVELDGTTVVGKVWNRRAKLAALQTGAGSGRMQGPALRLYDTKT